MKTKSLHVQLINPNALDQNCGYLYFEMDEKSRFKYKDDIKSGIAKCLSLSITSNYISLYRGNENVFYDVHKVLNDEHENKYIIVRSDNYEGSNPAANIYTQDQIAKKLSEEEYAACINSL